MKQQPVCDDKSLLIAYLYGECDPAERQLVEEHLARCANCAAEMDELRGVRSTLREWAPPEQALGFRVVRETQSPKSEVRSPTPDAGRRIPRWSWPRVPGRGPQRDSRLGVPVWAQAAAAVLVLAVGAGIATVDVRIGNGGVTIRTGWQKAPVAQVQTQTAAQGAAAPWRADLVALERQLRQEMSPGSASTTAPGVDRTAAAPTLAATTSARVSPEETATILRRVQTLIDDMERRQQREFDRQLAERFLRFARDVNSQRLADLRTIQQGFGQMDVRTTSEVAQLRQVQNYLLRVANVQEIK